MQGWAARKARDARRLAEHYEGTKALASPIYTLGMVDDLQLHIHLTPPMPEKFATASFEQFRGSLVRGLRTKWPAAAIVRISAHKPQGAHWASDVGRIRFGGSRAPKPFLSINAPNYATMQ